MLSLTRSITSNFPGGVCNVIQFRIELARESYKFDTLEQTGDELVMNFTEDINEEDIAIIDALISSHVPDVSYNKTTSPTIIITPSTTNSTFFTTWTTITVFVFKGTLELGIPTDLEIVALVQDTVTSGSFRIVDRSNANIIVEHNAITNKTAQMVELGAGTNWPRNEQILEIQMKQTGSTNEQKIILYELKIEFTPLG